MIDLLFAAMLQTASACNAVPAPRPWPASCPDWQLLANHPEADSLVDHSSVRHDGNMFEIRLRSIFPTPVGGGRSANTLMRFDCAARTARPLHLTLYDAGGAEITSGAPSGEMALARPVPPGTPTEALLARHCARGTGG